MGYRSNDIPGISSFVLTWSWGCFKITTVTSVLFCLLHNLNILLIKYFLSMTVFSYSNRKKKKKKKAPKLLTKVKLVAWQLQPLSLPPLFSFPKRRLKFISLSAN